MENFQQIIKRGGGKTQEVRPLIHLRLEIIRMKSYIFKNLKNIIIQIFKYIISLASECCVAQLQILGISVYSQYVLYTTL